MGKQNLAGNHEVFFGCGCCGGGIHQTKVISRLSRRRIIGDGIAGVVAATTLGGIT
jgi:hypothetical protein